MKTIFSSFWKWYEKHYTLSVSLTLLLFSLQLIHLYWLTTNVVALKLTNKSFFELTGIWYYLIILVDYTEIPALLSISLIYIHALTKKYSHKNLIYLTLIASQCLHLFWITDEFVVEQFTRINQTTVLPVWLAWSAILIDYLELPVIFDTIKKLAKAVRNGNPKAMKEALKK